MQNPSTFAQGAQLKLVKKQPECAYCLDTGSTPDPFSLGDTLPCYCQDGHLNLQAFNDSVAELFFQAVKPATPVIRGVIFSDYCAEGY